MGVIVLRMFMVVKSIVGCTHLTHPCRPIKGDVCWSSASQGNYRNPPTPPPPPSAPTPPPPPAHNLGHTRTWTDKRNICVSSIRFLFSHARYFNMVEHGQPTITCMSFHLFINSKCIKQYLIRMQNSIRIINRSIDNL